MLSMAISGHLDVGYISRALLMMNESQVFREDESVWPTSLLHSIAFRVFRHRFLPKSSLPTRPCKFVDADEYLFTLISFNYIGRTNNYSIHRIGLRFILRYIYCVHGL